MARSKYSATDIRQAASTLQVGGKIDNPYLRRLARAYNAGTLSETGPRKAARGHAAPLERQRYYESPQELNAFYAALYKIHAGSSKARAARSVGLTPGRFETIRRHHEQAYDIRVGKTGKPIKRPPMHAGKPDIGKRLLSPKYNERGKRVAGKHVFNTQSIIDVSLPIEQNGEITLSNVQVDNLNAQKVSIYLKALVDGLGRGNWKTFDSLTTDDRTIWAINGQFYQLTSNKRLLRSWFTASGLDIAELYQQLYKRSGASSYAPANF
jgi:hypothetical protein